MTRIRAGLAAFAGGAARLIRGLALVVVPETSEEAVVEVGLLLVAGAFLLAGRPELALGVPGGLLVLIGLGFTFRRGG